MEHDERRSVSWGRNSHDGEERTTSSPLSSGRLSHTDDPLGADVSGLPLRVLDLERLVREQDAEIAVLKSTVTDLQRRLGQVEGLRAVGKTSPAVSSLRAPTQRFVNGKHSGIARLEAPKKKLSVPDGHRFRHHESTGSLHSDGHSSNSVSPATSPSPTAAAARQQRHLPNKTASLTKRWSSATEFQHQQQRHSPVVSHTPLQVKMRRHSHAARPRRPESYAGGTLVEEPRDIWRLNSEPQTTPRTRRSSAGAMTHHHNSAGKGRLSHRPGTRDMSYNAEDGVLKIFLKGRPVNLYAPSDVMEEYDLNAVLPAPEKQLALQWAYGYRGKDCRNNLYLLPTGEMVYFVAGVVVLHNVDDQMQRHYTGHTDDVKCLAIHPNRTTIATGQCAGTKSNAQPQVHVWDSASLNTLHVLGEGELDRGVSCLAFSLTDGGAQLAIVDEGQDRTLSVWDWQEESKVTENKAANETVVDVQWHPLDKGVLMTCGRQHVNFWLLEAGSLQRRQGVFGGRDRPKYVTCMDFTDSGDLITGDSDGRILFWERGGTTVTNTVADAHEGTVFTLFVDKTGNVVSGGKDGKIIEWDREMTQTGNVVELPAEYGSPRMVSPGRGGQLLVGTTGNCVLTAEWAADPEPIVRGHTDEVWAAAAHPGRPQFATGGWDGRLFMWDLVTHAPVWTMDFEEGVQSASFSPDGSQLAVGLVSGRWDVLDADSHETVFSRTDGDEPIQTLRFSPDGNMLALGSRNNTVYIYEAGDGGFNRVAKCTGHSSFITHLDWSADSTLLRTNSGDYELLYWTAATGRQFTQASELRDTEWASHTCTLAFNSVGIYPEDADGTDVNTCCRSNDSSLMAAGDDWGRVKLFPYPANQAKTTNHSYQGHSSHVTHVEFFAEDDRLLSTGGRDMAVLQWAVE
ncbi:echinoderm microtubule-associated protein-like 2 isoform X1 [Amphibalanus amphitrite]|uniref:echinoderm microtubule-associated protein-like 2 isoform X1 n=1 Tax=Amphibalanus amphitrite TaxID=1232801 RepID=UPI001C90FBA0|nr:echinoderm microtubule-associated protein-like 2 isoform X1 [Amphibalanus amphitrite]